jgi:phosphonate utilization transcriptional regulator
MPQPRAKHVLPGEAGAAIALLQQQSLTTLVQREIERRITAGELAPGAKLNEAELAAAMGISRGPVREAFRALEQAGLVQTEKNRGVFVRQVSLEEANEIYEVRAALEGQMGRLAAKRITAAQIERLRGIVKRMHAVGRKRDPDAYFALNLEFHEALAEASGNRALAANYRRVVNELNLYRREAIQRNVEVIPISTQEHQAIVDAVVKRDERLAERLLYEHVINSRTRLHDLKRAAA